MSYEPNSSYWVALGASAGGLEALKEFLTHFKEAEKSYLVIAQHLDPKHPTILKELLARTTHYPIHLVEKDLKPNVGEVYIVSPGHNAMVVDGEIKLSPAAAVGPKPSIDVFLNSLAEDVGERAVAVILSGTGSDGAQGVMAVKSANGVVFAQDNISAKYSGMPDAATDTGAVDLVLRPSDIAKQISDFIHSSDKTLHSVKQPKYQNSLEKIFQRIFDETGYDFSGYKLKTIHRRIARRMAVHRLVTMDDYLTLLMSSSKEVESLFKDFLISVTEFFRDKSAFEDLNKVIDELVEKTAESANLRIWVPGCANGEEAYSIAILFHLSLTKHRKVIPFQVFASDIDEFALNQARKGYFSTAQVDSIEPKILEEFFQLKEGHYLVSKHIRDKVVFAKQNVITDPPFSKIDLISCRNLLIYFSQDLQRKVLQTFHFALKPNGYLFLGKSESALSATPELFDGMIKRSQIFIRKKIDLSRKMDQIQSANNYARVRTQQRPSTIQNEKQTIASRLDQILLDDVVPASIVIDASGQVLHIRGNVESYLNFPQGKIDTNILSLAKDDIKVDIRALMQKARAEGSASSQCLFYSGGDKELLFITIRSMLMTDDEQSYYLIAFMPAQVGDTFFVNTGDVEKESRVANEMLVSEVELFKERLQTSVEELETTNEELQSTNEELQSANEELQSTNEELQTANEELQSTNEELSTVNQELEVKSYELEQVNSDLESMLENMNELIILLDTRLRVVRYTKSLAQTFSLNRDVMHQTITTIGLEIDIPNLRNELLHVLDKLKEKVLKVRSNSVVYQLRLVPYQSETKELVGVLMFFESPVHRSTLEPFVDCHKTLQVLGDDLETGMISIDEIGIITYANKQALDYTGYELKDIQYKNIKMLMPAPYAEHHDSYLETYRSGVSKGLMGQWRDITIKKSDGDRVLMKLRVDDTWINAEKHFLGRILTVEEYQAKYDQES